MLHPCRATSTACAVSGRICRWVAAPAPAQRGVLEGRRRDRLPRSAQVSSDESERLIKMEETLHQRVIGQEEAVVAISRAIRRARVGLKNPNRPIASFIFSGAALHLLYVAVQRAWAGQVACGEF